MIHGNGIQVGQDDVNESEFSKTSKFPSIFRRLRFYKTQTCVEPAHSYVGDDLLGIRLHYKHNTYNHDNDPTSKDSPHDSAHAATDPEKLISLCGC